VACTEVANHDDSEWGLSRDVHPGTFMRSVYFQDPDGILLELACWIGPSAGDVPDVSAGSARAD